MGIYIFFVKEVKKVIILTKCNMVDKYDLNLSLIEIKFKSSQFYREALNFIEIENIIHLDELVYDVFSIIKIILV